MLPDFGDGKTYLLFLLSLVGELIVVSGYFVLTSWPFKDLAELRSKLIVRIIDKFYDGTMSLVFGSSVTMSVAGALMPPLASPRPTASANGARSSRLR